MKRVLVFLMLVFLMGFVLAGDKVVGVDFGDGEEVEVVVKIYPRGELGIRTLSSTGDDDESVVPGYELRKVSREELEEMEKDSGIAGIYSKHYIHAFLGESVPIINSDDVNSLQVNSLNLSGTDQTVCVIDTGVNFSHVDLLGKNVSCVVDCFDQACAENCSVGDDNGHGTHVAGIVGASGGITGVAPNVSLIGVKILGSDGGGSGNDNDVSNAIDYCVAQNVSVITMSLGTITLYDSYCDASVPAAWTSSVNAAFLKNISLVVASGNGANVTHISAPACIENATAVGDTYDGDVGEREWCLNDNCSITCTDATTALDKIVCHANRNSLVKLFAPGAMINSTSYTSGYAQFGGTSMATPVVAASIALINQYLNLSGQTRTPVEIENALNDTGVFLDDSGESGVNFSRINVYDALLSLDVDAPDVTLVFPVDNHVNSSVNYTFVCNATDWQLANVTFKIWNSTGLYYNVTEDASGIANETSFVLTDMPEDTYEWNCFVADDEGNVGNASNYTLTVGGAEVELISPVNGSYTNVEDVNFTCNSSSDSNYELSNVTFYLWNSTGNLTNSSTKNVSGFSNQSVFNYTLSVEDDYTWGCVAVNNNSDNESANYTLHYDNTAPVITDLASTVTDTTATISWTTNEEANSSASVSGGSWSNFSVSGTSHSIGVTGLTASSTYSYSVTSCDSAGNCAVNSSNSFDTDAETVETTTSVSSTSSNAGSDTDADSDSVDNVSVETVADVPVVYSPTPDVLSDGYDRTMKKDEKIKFRFVNSSVDYFLVVGFIGNDSVNLTVGNSLVNFSLVIGEMGKFNLSSPLYYDLFIRLNNITNGEASFTFQSINEVVGAGDGNDFWIWIYVLEGLLVVVGFGFVIYFIIKKIDRKDLYGSKKKPRGKHEKKLIKKELKLVKRGDLKLAKKEKKLKREKAKKNNGKGKKVKT